MVSFNASYNTPRKNVLHDMWNSEWDKTIKTCMRNCRKIMKHEYYEVFEKFYLNELSNPRINSRVTIYGNLLRLKQFLLWLQRNNISINDVDSDVCKKYLAFRRANGVKNIKDDIKTLKRLGSLLNRKLELPPMTGIQSRDLDPDSLITREDLEKLMKAMKSLEYKTQLAVMWECGLRLKEVRYLKLKDVKTEEWGFRLTIRREYTKTREGERVVAVVEYASLLAEWLNHHPTPNNPEAYLFPSPRDPLKPQSRGLFYQQLRRAAEKAGLNKRVYNHLLRHSAATRVYTLLGRMRPKEFLKFFGWKHMGMLNVYEHLAYNRADQAYVDAVLNRKREEKVEEYEPQIQKCPKCGALNNIHNIFCYRCGSKLKEAYVEKISEAAELSELHQLISELRELLKNREALKLLHKLSKINVE